MNEKGARTEVWRLPKKEEQNKSGNSQNFIENSHFVARPGFEPGTSGL